MCGVLRFSCAIGEKRTIRGDEVPLYFCFFVSTTKFVRSFLKPSMPLGPANDSPWPKKAKTTSVFVFVSHSLGEPKLCERKRTVSSSPEKPRLRKTRSFFGKRDSR